MPVTVNCDGLSLCHKGSDGSTTCTVPDVCLTPSGPVPVAYTNVAYSSDLAKGTVTVFADGGNMCAINGSEFAKSIGDEPGTAGGVASGTYMKEATWVSYSPDIKAEGAEVCRLTDLMLHNHSNTINSAGELQAPLPTTAADNEECPQGKGKDIDGQYMGSDGKGGCVNYPDAKDPSEVNPITPQNGPGNAEIIHINGINNTPCDHCKALQDLANHKCANVVGIYNNSNLGEAIMDKANLGDGNAVDTLSDLITRRAESGQPLNISAHSHGGLVTSRALSQSSNALGGLPSNINVDTYGAAAWTYPSGPTYTHWANVIDVVPMLTGRGAWLLAPILGAASGSGLVTALAGLGLLKNFPSDTNFFLNLKGMHGFNDVYLPRTPKTYC